MCGAAISAPKWHIAMPLDGSRPLHQFRKSKDLAYCMDFATVLP